MRLRKYYSSSGSRKFFWLIKLWGSFKSIIEEQYILARKCGMGIEETNRMADFERSIYVSLVIKEMEEQNRSIDQAK